MPIAVPFITYRICPECGRGNPDALSACPACGTKLLSEDRDGHERYVRNLSTERKKQIALLCGLTIISGLSLTLTIGMIVQGKTMPGYTLVGFTAISVASAYKRIQRIRFLRRFARSLRTI